MKILRKIFRVFGIVIAVFVLLGLFVFVFVSLNLPDVSQFERLPLKESSQIFDRDGNLMYTIHGDENREKVDFDKISDYLVNATVTVEDDAFWSHFGIDVWGTGRAVMYEFFDIGIQRGGSTITQQYAKNAFLSSEKTYSRKLKEMILAVNLEFYYDKETILELYLNKIPYGNNAYGCKKAAEVYFSEDVKHLSLAESVVLAALPQAPSRFNPYGDNRYSHLLKEFSDEELEEREILTEKDLWVDEFERGLIGQYVDLSEEKQVYISGRSDSIIDKMYSQGMISLGERKSALDELLELEFEAYFEEIHHPHFVFYIINELEETYGREFLEQGGLKIYTTLDPELQTYVEDLALRKKRVNLWNYGADNMAVLTVDVKTGEILAMLGSVDYYDEEIDGQVNVVMRPRQPGSSFKPFVYTRAFMNGYSPGHPVYDSKMLIGSRSPQNYDGKYLGQITMREALGKSRNIPAIKAYYLAGEQNEIIDMLEDMGISSLDKQHDYGYPLALGAGEVSMFEMVQGYSVLANNGKKVSLNGVLSIADKNGEILEEFRPSEGEEVIPAAIAYLINNVLSDSKVRIGPKLAVNRQIVAAKTGTSTKKSKSKYGSTVRPGDTWTIGYTPSFVTAVWLGNTDGRGLYWRANGYDLAAPIFTTVMREVLKDKDIEPFVVPSGVEFVWVSKVSGKLVNKYTPKKYRVKEPYASDYFVPSELEYGYFTKDGKRLKNKRPGTIADFQEWGRQIKAFY